MDIRTIKEQICDVCHTMWQLGRYPAKLPHLVADIANLLLNRLNIHKLLPT